MTIKLQIKNTVTRIICTPELTAELRELLSYEVEGSHFAMRNLPHGAWDGKKRLMKKDGSFPAGLTARVLGYLMKRGLKVDHVDDLRVKPPTSLTLSLAHALEPRDYQTEFVGMTDDRPRGVAVIGTGGGKTITALLTIIRRGVPTLFIVPDKGLKEQAADEFAYWLGKSTLVGRKLTDQTPIVVVNIHQVAKADEKIFSRFHMLMIDEFHHAAADTYKKLNALASSAYWRYGFTGTNIRTDGRDMEMHGVLSAVLLRRTTSDLIEAGFLVPPEIRILRHRVKGYSKLNYQQAYTAMTTDDGFNARIAAVAREKIREEKKQTLILVRRREHGQRLDELLCGDAVYINGDDPIEHRQKVKADFAAKRIPCMIATDIFGEGQDIPSIDCLINCRLQESEIQTKQGIGRALRLAKGTKSYAESVSAGKSKAEIVDFLIEGHRHLSGHSLSRIEQYRSERAFKLSIDE